MSPCERGRGKGQEPVGTSGVQKVLELENRANGILQFSAVCVGVRGQHREDAVLERYGGRCPLLLKGAEGPRLEGTQSGAVRKEPQGRRTTRKPRGPSAGGSGASPLPHPEPECTARATQPRQPEAARPSGGSGRRVKAAVGGGRRRRGHCYSGTKTRGAGTPGAGEGTRLPRRHVGRGQLLAGPAPARRQAGPEEQGLGIGAGVRGPTGLFSRETPPPLSRSDHTWRPGDSLFFSRPSLNSAR